MTRATTTAAVVAASIAAGSATVIVVAVSACLGQKASVAILPSIGAATAAGSTS